MCHDDNAPTRIEEAEGEAKGSHGDSASSYRGPGEEVEERFSERCSGGRERRGRWQPERGAVAVTASDIAVTVCQ